MRLKKLINLEDGSHINYHQTAYSKQSLYANFYCQNLIDTDFFKRWLLMMKSRSYVWSIGASVNREDLSEVEAKNDLHREKGDTVKLMAFSRDCLLGSLTSLSHDRYI